MIAPAAPLATHDRPWRRELGHLIALGVPMGLTQLIQFSINAVDVMMIGRLGAEPLAAASLGQVLFYTLWLVGLGPTLAVTPMVAQSLGANPDDVDDVRRSVRMGLWLVLLMMAPALLFVAAAEPIALGLGQPAVLAEQAAPYLWTLLPGLPFALGVMVLRQFLASIGRTRFPLLVIVLTTILNALLNYVLIYGSFGAPRLGLLGAGIASSLAHLAGFLALVVYVQVEDQARRFQVFAGLATPDWPRLWEIWALGWPITVTIGFEIMLFNSGVFLMGLISVDAVAAYQVALNVAALAFMMPLGFAQAGGVRVGLAAGARDRARVRRACVLTFLLAATTILVVALPAGLIPHWVASLYLDVTRESNARLVDLVTLFLPIAGAFALFDASQVSAAQCLRGLKDVRVPMLVAGVSYWAVGFPVAAGLGLGTPVGAVGVWWGFLAALGCAAILLGLRLWRLTRDVQSGPMDREHEQSPGYTDPATPIG